MTLTFLGQPYEATLTEAPQPSPPQTGKYRGAAVKFSAIRVAPRSNMQLTYRGTQYMR